MDSRWTNGRCWHVQPQKVHSRVDQANQETVPAWSVVAASWPSCCSWCLEASHRQHTVSITHFTSPYESPPFSNAFYTRSTLSNQLTFFYQAVHIFVMPEMQMLHQATPRRQLMKNKVHLVFCVTIPCPERGNFGTNTTDTKYHVIPPCHCCQQAQQVCYKTEEECKAKCAPCDPQCPQRPWPDGSCFIISKVIPRHRSSKTSRKIV